MRGMGGEDAQPEQPTTPTTPSNADRLKSANTIYAGQVIVLPAK